VLSIPVRAEALVAIVVGVAIASGGLITSASCAMSHGCTTCNIRNEVLSHVRQLPIDAFEANNPSVFRTSESLTTPAPNMCGTARAETRDAYGCV